MEDDFPYSSSFVGDKLHAVALEHVGAASAAHVKKAIAACKRHSLRHQARRFARHQARRGELANAILHAIGDSDLRRAVEAGAIVRRANRALVSVILATSCVGSNVVDTVVRSLRKKLGPRRDCIQTVPRLDVAASGLARLLNRAAQ